MDDQKLSEMEQVLSGEIKVKSDRSVPSPSSDLAFIVTQSDRSSRGQRKSSVTSSTNMASGGNLQPDSINIASDDSFQNDVSGAMNDNLKPQSSNAVKEGGKGVSGRTKDKKVDKPTVDCLNLVSKACFRKVPPSSFYLFFRPRSTKVEYSYSKASTDKDVSGMAFILPEGTQKGILHTDKEVEVTKEPIQKTVKIQFGIDQGKVKSDQSVSNSSKKDEETISSETPIERTDKLKKKKIITKPKKRALKLQKEVQGSSQETVEAPISSTEQDKFINFKTTGKKKGKVASKITSSVPESATEMIEKKTVKKKYISKFKKRSKSVKSDREGVPSDEADVEEHNEGDAEADEHVLERGHSEKTLKATGSFKMVDGIDAAGAVVIAATGSEEGIDKVWKSGMILSADEVLITPDALQTEHIPVVIPSSVREGSLDSADSSSSSSSDSVKSKKSSTQVAVPLEEKDVDADHKEKIELQISQTNYARGASLLPSQSFNIGLDFFHRGSYMVQREPSMLGRLDQDSMYSLTSQKPPDVLQAVSSCTVQLLKTYNALVDDKSNENWAPIKELMSVMSYDELTRRRESELEDDLETHTDSHHRSYENQEDDQEMIPGEVREAYSSSSSQTLGSDVIPAAGSSVLGPSRSRLMPDKFSEIEFMKYFCSDWERVPYQASEKPEPKKIVSVKEEVSTTVSEAIHQIDPDASYDVIFTYKMPKSAPFDLNDSLADVRFKCMRKWMNDNINAMYKALYDSELRGKAEEKVIRQLMEKMIGLQLKIREYEDLIHMKPIYSPRTESSKSTFSVDTDFNDKSEGIEEEEGFEESSEHPSDEQIDVEIRILMTKLEQLRPEDSEVKEKRIVESVDTSMTEHHISEKVSQSCQSVCSSGSGSKRVALETRGKRRRKEIKEQLEKVMSLLEKKLNRLKIKIEALQIEEYEQENEETSPLEPPFASKRSRSNHPDLRTPEDSPVDQDTLIRDIEAKLRRDFLISLGSKNRSKRSETVSRGESHRSTRKNADFPTRRLHLQQYLLGVTDTWYQEGDGNSFQESDIKDERLLVSLRKEDIQAGIKHVKHQRKHMKYLPWDQPKAKVKSLEEEDSIRKSQQAQGYAKVKTTGSDQPKNRTTLDPHVQVPFTCKCLCDRVSRFNVKRKEHFRTVLNENLWCIRSNPQLITGEEPKSQHSTQELGGKTLCPPEEVDEPDNYKGWLADTDRNLLLLFNRSPLERLNKNYYGPPEPEKRQPSPEMEKDDSRTVLKSRFEELLKKISKQEAEKFWVKVEQWYENYKKCDKTRQLIEEFEKIDINAMMKRDLSSLKNETKEKLKADKLKIKLHLELQYRRKFFENLKKLRDEYECSVRNRIAAKEKEMEAKKSLIVQSTLRDMKDKFEPIKKEHKKRCIEWMAQIRDRTNATSQTVKQREARELALMVDKMDVAERTRKKLVAASGKEHEEMEKTLGEAVQERDLFIEELDRKVLDLTRDVGIWKRAVREVLNSFKKFMYYILETRPDRSQYFLSLEKLYQIQMDDMIREASEELKKVETNESTSPGKGDVLQPTMEIKCPSHDIRYPSERSTRTGSSSDTDIEKDTRAAKVAAHAVDAAIRAVLPSPEMSVGGEDEGRIEDLEELISLFVIQDSQAKVDKADATEELCEEETREKSVRGPIVAETSDPEIPVGEFTRRRIRDMLKIISRRKPQIKGHIHM